MRGSLITGLIGIIAGGIIPAHAGLTALNDPRILSYRDHPRACGAHKNSISSSHDLTGSSPRMRGSPNGYISAIPVSGIIPAHAGLTITAAQKAMTY